MGVLIIGLYFGILIYDSINGNSNTFTQTTIDNNFDGGFREVVMSTNNYTFDASIQIKTWK